MDQRTDESQPKTDITALGSSSTISRLKTEIATLRSRTEPATKREIAAQLAALEAIYGAPVGWEESMGLYMQLLAHLPTGVLIEAVERHIRTSKWFPKPSELLDGTAEEIHERRGDHDRALGRLLDLEAPPDIPRLQAIAQGSGRSAGIARERLAALGIEVEKPREPTGEGRPHNPRPIEEDRKPLRPLAELLAAPKAIEDPAIAAQIAEWSRQLGGLP